MPMKNYYAKPERSLKINVYRCVPVLMQVKREGNRIFAKLEKGEDVLEKLSQIVAGQDVKNGEILWGVGMIKGLQVGYFNGKEYEKETYRDNLEVVSFHGSIAENEPKFHIHTSCAGRNHGVVGGHLFGGMADPLLEVSISVFDKIRAERKINPASGLKEIDLI